MMKKFSQGGMGKLMRGLGRLAGHEGQVPGIALKRPKRRRRWRETARNKHSAPVLANSF